MNFEVRNCHKWEQLLIERKAKFDQTLCAVEKENFDSANKLVSQVFMGVMGGKQADPGMASSLLYHMAMVTKMEPENQVLLDELNVNQPDVSESLRRIHGEFYTDAQELVKVFTILNFDAKKIAATKHLSSGEKIALFTKLKEQQKKDYLTEDSWCVYQPNMLNSLQFARGKTKWLQ